jgi:hypothetical protein
MFYHFTRPKNVAAWSIGEGFGLYKVTEVVSLEAYAIRIEPMSGIH